MALRLKELQMQLSLEVGYNKSKGYILNVYPFLMK